MENIQHYVLFPNHDNGMRLYRELKKMGLKATIAPTPRAASTQNWFWMEKMFLSMSWKPTATRPIRQSIRLPAAMTVLRLEGSQLSWR